MFAPVGFEVGATRWGDGQVVSGISATGRRSLELKGGYALFGEFPAQGGKRYKIQLQVKCQDVPQGAAFVQLAWRGEGVDEGWVGPYRVKYPDHYEKAVLVMGGSFDWREFSTVIQAPAGAEGFYIYLRKLPKTPGTVWYDDVVICETEEPVTMPAEENSGQSARLARALPEQEAKAAIARLLAEAKTPAGPFTLVSGGTAECRLYVGGREPEAEYFAALELAKYVKKMTGVMLDPIFNDANPATKASLIIIGTHNALAPRLASDLEKLQLGEDGFLIRTAGKHLLLCGGSPRGTLYGVYYLLRQFGCRWYADDTEAVPHKQDLVLPHAVNVVERPRFKYREVFCPEGGRDGDFAARSALNGQLGHRLETRPLQPRHGYGVPHIEGYNIGLKSAFAPETQREAIAACRAALEKHLGERKDALAYVKISHIDGGAHATGGRDGEFSAEGGSDSAPLMYLANVVAKALKQEYPNVVVLGEAYLWSLPPCNNVKFEPNAGVSFAPIEANWAQPLNGPNNERLFKYLEGWCKQTQHVVCWLYITNFSGYLQPLPNLYPMAETLRALGKLPQVEGVFLQDSYSTEGGSFAPLHTWLFSKLLWNPEQDARGLVKEFYQGYYGPAWQAIDEYIEALHASEQAHPSRILTKASADLPYLNAPFRARADQLLDRAEAEVKDEPLYLAHVKRARLGIDWVSLLNGAKLAAEAKQQGLPWISEAERLERFKQNLKVVGVTSFGEDVGKLEDTLEALAIPRRLPSSPPQAKGLKAGEWVDCQEVGFMLSDAELVADTQASNGAAARMRGDTDTWGIQVKLQMLLPETGKWDLYAAVRIDKGEGPDSAPAVLAGVSPGP